MSFRKPFNKLSERQQRRRLAKEVADEIEEIETDCESENEDTIEPMITESSLPHEPLSNSIEPEDRIDDCNINLVEEDYNESNLDAYEFFLSNLSLSNNGSDEEYLSEESDAFSSNEDRIDEDEDEEDNENDDENTSIEGFDLKNALRAWKSEFCITQVATDKLLLILREAGHADLPKTSRSLINTPRFTKIDICPPGEYFHYGLEKSLKDTLARNFTIKEKETNINIDINIDGLPITKSTKRTLWPI